MRKQIKNAVKRLTGLDERPRWLQIPRVLPPSKDVIVTYHGVVDRVLDQYLDRGSLTRAEFERQIELLGRHFDFATLDEIIERLGARKRPGRPKAAITFDDGLECAYHNAMEDLWRRGIPFMVCLSPGLIQEGRSVWGLELDVLCLLSDRPQITRPPIAGRGALELPLGNRQERMTASKTLREEALELAHCPFDYVTRILAHFGREEFERMGEVYSHFLIAPPTQFRTLQGKGVTVAAHGYYHVPLDSAVEETLHQEVSVARTALEGELDLGPVHHFVVPYGRFTPAVDKAVRQAGFRSLCTTFDRPIEPGDGAFGLPRVDARSDHPRQDVGLMRRLS